MKYKTNQRVPVINNNGTPLMPTRFSKAKRLIKEEKAMMFENDFGIFCIKLRKDIINPKIQDISLGIDPGKHYTGIGVQSAKFTLLGAHVELPIDENSNFKHTKYNLGEMNSNVVENRNFEIEVANKLFHIFPIKHIIYEVSKTKKDISECNQTIVGQFWIVDKLKELSNTTALDGVVTSRIRKILGFIKQNKNKGDAKPETQAVDGIALSTHHFSIRKHRKKFILCHITPAPFVSISKIKIGYNSKKRRNIKSFVANTIKSVNYGIILTSKGHDK